MTNWMPIETAPKDQRLMLFWPTCELTWARVVFGKYDDQRWAKSPRPFWTHDLEYLLGRYEARDHQPTMWAPVPDEPA